jgi:hypothetical protein
MGSRGSIEYDGNVSDPDRRRRSYQIGKRELIHEVIQELTIFYPLDAGDVNGFRTWLLALGSRGGKSKSS